MKIKILAFIFTVVVVASAFNICTSAGELYKYSEGYAELIDPNTNNKISLNYVGVFGSPYFGKTYYYESVSNNFNGDTTRIYFSCTPDGSYFQPVNHMDIEMSIDNAIVHVNINMPSDRFKQIIDLLFKLYGDENVYFEFENNLCKTSVITDKELILLKVLNSSISLDFNNITVTFSSVQIELLQSFPYLAYRSCQFNIINEINILNNKNGWYR